MSDTKTIIFTDGASRGNPGPGGWGVVVLHDSNRVKELGGRADETTNNRMELSAAIGALKYLEYENITTPVVLYSDSRYVVDGITKWIFGWMNRGWQTKAEKPVENKELWQDLHDISYGFEIEWKKLPGHSGVGGNQRADAIATAFADNEDFDLFSGSLADYNKEHDINLLDISVDSEKQKKRRRKKQKAYSYLSLVNDEAKRHTSWKETQSRVKGVSGAKFKKAISPEDERNILKEWGVDPDDLE